MRLNLKGENVPLYASIVKQISATTCMQRMVEAPLVLQISIHFVFGFFPQNFCSLNYEVDLIQTENVSISDNYSLSQTYK